MEKYLGVKEILAKPMTQNDYLEYMGSGSTLPVPNELNKDGYLVEYLSSPNKNHPNHDNYISWSPEDDFERSYRKTTAMTYGLAIEAMRKGYRIAREGWSGKGLFVFRQISSEIGLDIIPKMQSVPQSVKDAVIKSGTVLRYTNGMIIIHPDGRADSWVASSSDTFAEDWKIL